MYAIKTHKICIAVIGMIAAALGGCGSSDGLYPTPAPADQCQWGDIVLDTPTYNNTWGTSSATVDLSGPAVTPGGMYDFSNCPGDPGYTIEWTNETTGASGLGDAWNSVEYGFFGPFCSTHWMAYGVPLALNNNHITIKASRAGAQVGADCLDVRRMPEATGSWQPISTVDAPSPRYQHTAVWTGTKMIVWGGYDGSYLASGGRYDPVADTWSPVSANGAPTSRRSHTAVWTGTEMIVWGGYDGGNLASGGRYDPSTDSWTATNAIGAPAARVGHTAVWTGNEMLVWGGYDSDYLASGVRYNPVSDSWTPITSIAAPTARTGHTAVWTGNEMIVWGGVGSGPSRLNDGARYNPMTDTWSQIAGSDAPEARNNHTAVWTGTGMIVWGGEGGSLCCSTTLATGGVYDLAANKWTATWSAGVPSGREDHSAVWSGSEMIIWGGYPDLALGSRYYPVTDTWTPTISTAAPAGRYDHSAVWTGSEMVIWGGGYYYYGGYYLNSGGSYTP